MKILLLIQVALILVMTSTSAVAEWELVAIGSDGRTFVDKSTIRKKGEVVQVWTMIDKAKAESNAEGRLYLSDKELLDIDCANLATSIAAIVMYSLNMGAGDVVANHTFKEFYWQPVVPDSYAAIVVKIACANKKPSRK